MKEKQEAVKKKKENSFKKKEKQMSDVIFYGLWQSSSVADDILRSINQNNREKGGIDCTVKVPAKCFETIC